MCYYLHYSMLMNILWFMYFWYIDLWMLWSNLRLVWTKCHPHICMPHRKVMSLNVWKYDVHHNHTRWFKTGNLMYIVCHNHKLLLHYVYTYVHTIIWYIFLSFGWVLAGWACASPLLDPRVCIRSYLMGSWMRVRVNLGYINTFPPALSL